MSAPLAIGGDGTRAPWKERRWKSQRWAGGWYQGTWYQFSAYGSFKYNGSQLISGYLRCSEWSSVGFTVSSQGCYREAQKKGSMDSVDRRGLHVLGTSFPATFNRWTRTRTWVSGSIQRWNDRGYVG